MTPTKQELYVMYVLNISYKDILENRKLRDDELKIKKRSETIKKILNER